MCKKLFIFILFYNLQAEPKSPTTEAKELEIYNVGQYPTKHKRSLSLETGKHTDDTLQNVDESISENNTIEVQEQVQRRASLSLNQQQLFGTPKIASARFLQEEKIIRKKKLDTADKIAASIACCCLLTWASAVITLLILNK